jgi:hypothetical protein
LGDIPFWKTWWRDVFAREIEEISVSSCVADGGNVASFACVEMVLGELQ